MMGQQAPRQKVRGKKSTLEPRAVILSLSKGSILHVLVDLDVPIMIFFCPWLRQEELRTTCFGAV
jgi:hypothetical protein